MDVSQYLDIFIDETTEHLQALNEHILILEKEPDNEETINEIFRAAHSLKGMAGTMGFTRMQKLTHDMENVFSEIRSGNMKVTDNLVDVLFRGIDALETYLECIQETATEGIDDHQDIINQLNDILKEGTKSQPDKIEAEPESKVCVLPGGKEKYKSIKFADYEKNAILDAVNSGMRVYGMTVYIEENCLLKAARAFLVFRAMEEVGEMIKSDPSVQNIEDEKFDLDFSMIVLSKEDMEKVRFAAANVSEIKEVVIGEISLGEEEKPEKEEGTSKGALVEKTNNAAVNQKIPNTAVTHAKSPKTVVNRTVRVDIDKLDILMNLVSELIIAKNGLVSIGAEISDSRNSFNEQIEYLESITTNLHEYVMKVRMVPIENVVNRFPRMIRDLSKKLGKKMELYMTGEDTELDRTLIDEIGDPLMHILRNSADHGIESAQDRIKAGKPEQGSIFLDAYQEGNNVVIECRDDGSGINIEKVKHKAIERELVTPDQAEDMTEQDFIAMLFEPSFSTADKVTDVSGRGVGLDVVKSKIEALGGDIECKSVPGEGTSFIIRLPLTLAIIQALMVEIGTEKYAIPLGNIQTIEDVGYSDIKYVQSNEVINLRGNVIPLIRMGEILDVESSEPNSESLTVVIIAKGDKMAGLVVDNLLGQQEIVIKPLGKYININKIIGGATILGDGEVALILDVNTLI